jgi:hypothetical protein
MVYLYLPLKEIMKGNSLYIFRLAKVSFVRSCIAFLFIFVCSCQGPRYLRRQHLLEKDTSVHIAQTGHDSIIVHYIGCSGFFIKKGTSTLLFDPYFSYKAGITFRLTNEAHIRSRLQKEIGSVFSRSIGTEKDDKGTISALVIGHAHVDHFGDVPYLYHSGHLNSGIKIIGSTTTGHYLRGHDIPEKNIIPAVEASASSWLSDGAWVYVNKHVRLLPIISEHAPHARLLGRGIYVASSRHEKKDVTHGLPPCYGTGQTLSYIVDFLNDDSSINFRAYHSSAAGNAPNGFPPASVLAQHRIDLAIVCAASFNQVKDYPESLVRHLNPRHILFSHWEDFMFSSITRIKKHPHANYFYSYRKFFRRANRLLHDMNGMDGTTQYSLPNVDTKMTFYY